MRELTLIFICSALFVVCGVLLVFGAAGALAQSASTHSTDVSIDVRDYCDPVSFDAALGDGACVRSTVPGFITFDGFLAELGADQSVGAWRFAPNQISVANQSTLHLHNSGGETHTFTQVKEFGGGFVPELNGPSGNPVPAPECLAAPNDDNIFIPPGTDATVTLKSEVSVKYQCCVHPWMRVTITPRDQHHTQVH